MNDESKCADDIVIECDLPHPPEKVWQAITDQDLVGQWLSPSDLRPEVGARFRLPPAHQATDAPMIDCEVIEAIPYRSLRWRQVEREIADDTAQVQSVVTLELSPNEGGTHLRIVHDEFRRLPVDAVASSANVIRFEPRTKPKALSARRLVIVCTGFGLRRAA